MRLIRKSSCTSVHCGFRIFANLEIPPFGLASLSHAPLCRVLSAAPALSHCMPRIAVVLPATPALSHCRVFIHHVRDVIARNRICPVFSILSYHTLLIRLIHSILFYPILFYSILSLPSIPPVLLAQVHLACFPGISVSGVPPKYPTWHSFLHSGNRKRAAS